MARELFGEDKTVNCVSERVQQLLSPAFAHNLLGVLAGINESQVNGDKEQFPLFLKARRKWRHHADSKRQPWWPSDPNPLYFDLLYEYVFEQQARHGYGRQPLPSTSTPVSPSLATPTPATPTLPKSPAPKEVFNEKFGQVGKGRGQRCNVKKLQIQHKICLDDGKRMKDTWPGEYIHWRKRPTEVQQKIGGGLTHQGVHTHEDDGWSYEDDVFIVDSTSVGCARCETGANI
ncbi:hypothetical protein TKK_0010322 [Trichogramma kaykai]